MQSPTLREFNEPGNHVCLFFINKNHIFAASNPPEPWKELQKDIQWLERRLGATFSGRMIFVEEYNNFVKDGISPVIAVQHSMAGGEHADRFNTCHTLTTMSLQM